MSLLLVPLQDASGPGDVVQEAVYEAMSLHLVRLVQGAGVDGGDGQPLRVVPYCGSGWEHPSQDARAAGILLTTLATWQEGPPQDEFYQRLERGFRDCLEVLLHSGDTRPVAVLCPIVRIPEAEDEVTKVLARLQEVWDLLDLAAAELARSMPPTNFRVIPWVYSSSVPDQQRAPALYSGPTLSSGGICPLFFGLPGYPGIPLDWNSWGRTQLVGAILTLHYLSARMDRLDDILPETHPREGLFAAHLSLLSCPLEAAVERRELDRIRKDLPPTDVIEEAAEQQSERVRGLVEPLLDALRRTIQRPEVPSGSFSFGPRAATASEGRDPKTQALETIRSRLELDDFSFHLRPGAEEMGGFDRVRRADDLHTRFVRKAGLLYEEGLGELTDGALKAALDDVASQTARLEECIQGLLENAAGPDPDLANSGGRVVAACRLCERELELLTRFYGDQEAPSPEKPLEQAERLRQSWLRDEESLHQAGADLPGIPAILAEATAVFLVVALGGWLLLLALTNWQDLVRGGLSLLSGGLVAALVAWCRIKQAEEHEARWMALAERMKSEADAVGAELSKVVEHRLSFLKLGTCSTLRTGLRHASERLLVEMGGVSAMVDGLLASHRYLDESGAARQSMQAASQEQGRFKVDIPEAPATGPEGLQALATRLRGLWKGTLSLSSLTGRVPTRKYREAIDRVIQAALSDSHAGSLSSSLQSAVDNALTTAINSGHDLAFLPPEARAPKSILLVGHGLGDVPQATARDGTYLERPESDSEFPSDRAVALQIILLPRPEASTTAAHLSQGDQHGNGGPR